MLIGNRLLIVIAYWEKYVMPQASREAGAYGKMQSARDKAIERCNLANAVTVLNDALVSTKPLPHQKVTVAMFMVNKLLPSMQAVAVQVEHKVSADWKDIQAQALEAGIDPNLLIPQEKPLLPTTVSDGGVPPDDDA